VGLGFGASQQKPLAFCLHCRHNCRVSAPQWCGTFLQNLLLWWNLQAQPLLVALFFGVSNRVCVPRPPRASTIRVLVQCQKIPDAGRAGLLPSSLSRLAHGRSMEPEPLARRRNSQLVRARVRRIGRPGGAVILLSPDRFLFPRASARAASWQTRCPSVRARVRIIDCGQGRWVVGCEILSPFRAGKRSGPLRNDSGQR
jgi:hypothetical protein